MQQYGIAVKESRGQLSYLPSGRTKFIRAKHLGDKFDKDGSACHVAGKRRTQAQGAVQAGYHRETDRHPGEAGRGQGHQAMSVGAQKHNLKAMAQTRRSSCRKRDLTQRGRPEPAHRRTGNQVPRRAGSGERPRRSHENQQRAALSRRSLHQHQESRTAVKELPNDP